MSWREELRTASWRGIECFYDGADDERGRRLAEHAYPQRDDADIEDMGRKVRRYRITLYILASVLGDGYWPRRDQLLAAFEAEGPGTLVHPYYGELDVHCESAAPRYSTREGGQVTFSCVFVEAKAPQQPRQAARTDALMRSHADTLLAQVDQQFIQDWVLDQVPEPVREAARRGLDAAQNAMALRDGLRAAGFEAGIALQSGLSSAQRVLDFLRPGRDALASGGLARVRQARGFAATLPTIDGDTPSRRTARANQAAISRVVEATTLAAGTDVVSRTVFDSVDDAIAARDEILDEIDEQALTAPDPVFRALQDLRAALVADIQARGAGLPNVRTIRPAATEPALVIAHRLYGDATREADIVARNRIAHPGFVPGGEPIEVLTDAA